MNTSDQDTVLQAMEDAKVGEYNSPHPPDATFTLHRLPGKWTCCVQGPFSQPSWDVELAKYFDAF
jgi:hypothetical protein